MRFGPRWHRLDDGPPADLSAFVDGELRGRHRRRVARHLRACPACRLVVEQLRRVRALTAELAVDDARTTGVAQPAVPAAWWSASRHRRE